MKRFALAVMITGLAVPVTPAYAGGGGCGSERARQGAGTVVEIFESCFTPNILNAATGTTVTFRNTDQMIHTVTAGIGSWGQDHLDPGRSLTHTFTRAGLYPFYCRYHQRMGGIVKVGADTPSTSDETPPTIDADPVASPDGSAGGPFVIPLGAGLLAVGGGVGFTLGRKRGKA